MLLNLAEILRPESLAEATAQLGRVDRPTRILAGGTELVGGHDPRTVALVDISRLGIVGISANPQTLVIGAMTSLKSLADDPSIQTLAGGILAEAVARSAPATIRAAATLGGTLCGLKGGDEIPTALLALGATITLWRTEPTDYHLADFLALRSELLRGAIMTEVTIPAADGHLTGGLAIVSRSPADRAITVAAAVIRGDDVRIALGGVATYPRLLPLGTRPDEVEAVIAEWEAAGDFRASGQYRRWVGPTLCRRAIEHATGGVQR